MYLLDKILLATDFSVAAQPALRYSVELALRFDARLDVFHAILPNKPGLDEEHMRQMVKKGAETRLEEVVRKHLGSLSSESANQLEIRYVGSHAESAQSSIVAFAEENGSDLIVMGTHGTGGIRRSLFGSVAEAVVRSAPCPVLTVRSLEDVATGAVNIERILVPTDFSDNSRTTLPLARQMGSVLNARLDLLHVIPELTFPESPYPYMPSLENIDSETQTDVITSLRNLYDEAEGPVTAIEYRVLTGSIAGSVLEYAEEHNIDMVVMSTLGLRGFARLFLGSVAETVLRQAPCPVLTINRGAGKLGVDIREEASADPDIMQV